MKLLCQIDNKFILFATYQTSIRKSTDLPKLDLFCFAALGRSKSNSDSKVLEMKIADFNGKVSELWDALMGLELQLVDQLEVHMQQMIVMHSLQNQIQSSLSQL